MPRHDKALSYKICVAIDFLAADTLEGRAAGTRGGRAAGQYLIQELQKLGWKPGSAEQRYDQPFNANMRNILAIWPGSDPQLKQELLSSARIMIMLVLGPSQQQRPYWLCS